MAFAALLPAIISVATSVAGAASEGAGRKKMARERAKWAAENTSLFNRDYYSNYMDGAEAQNAIRQMREELRSRSRADQNSQAVLGTTNAVSAANKEGRNKAMASLYGALASRGQLRRDEAKGRYLSRRYGLEGLEHDEMSKTAQSANNMMYNGLQGLSGMDWADVFKSFGAKTSGGLTSSGGGGGKA
ncbi:MAG: hypothetical protein LBH80_02825 [Prevotellaceae bacterium]|jgi:hypothetical protein|nr:hypothetical protein [Prevotellaceae bacterium]